MTHFYQYLPILLGLLAGAETAQAEILVGVAGPLTGPNAAVGEQFRRGATMAAETINANGGIDGEQVVLSFGDDASDPKQGISVANRFVADGVTYVIGHYNSGVSIPASEVYAENGILQITPASTNPVFTERSLWNTIRICGRDDQQGAVAGKYIVDKLQDKPLAIIHDQTAYGAGIAGEVKKTINAAGVKEVTFEGINPGEKDFSVLIAKLKEQGVQAIYFGGLYTEAGLLVRQAADQGLKAVLIGGDGIASSEFAAIAGPAAEGTLMTFAPDPRQNPTATPIVQAFRSNGFEPEAYTLYAYAALEILKQGIEGGGSRDPQAVADFLLSSDQAFQTAIGPIMFDGKGDRRDQDYTVYKWGPDSSGSITYTTVQ